MEKEPKRKILIIDDNEQDRKIMQSFLSKAGFEEILTAENGEEGLKKVKSERLDLVIIDTMLPDTDGFQVCRRIREIYDATALKIIIMTGSIDAVDAVEARKAGADDYCVKTSDFSSMLEAVEKLI